jgi:chromatin structure-remodeling complex subunit RSC1/2
MEVDVGGMSPEPEGQGDEIGVGVGVERDPESEEIVRQLEKSLPRWKGFGDEGWMEEVNPVSMVSIV